MGLNLEHWVLRFMGGSLTVLIANVVNVVRQRIRLSIRTALCNLRAKDKKALKTHAHQSHHMTTRACVLAAAVPSIHPPVYVYV